MCMSLSHRLQVLIDEARWRRLEAAAERRGESVAALVREAIDQAFPDPSSDRRRAGELLLSAEPMTVCDWAEMKDDLLSKRAGKLG